MGIRVRGASPEDADWLLGQLKAFARFYGTKKSLFGNEAHARTSLLHKIHNHLVLIAEHDTLGPIGFISGYVLPHPFNPEIRLLSETFWWVDEDHRGGRAGLMLLNAFTEWGKANCDWITFALEHHSPVTEKALTRRGFSLQERSYLMEVS
jgi:hypothetical protein